MNYCTPPTEEVSEGRDIDQQQASSSTTIEIIKESSFITKAD